MYVLDGIAYAGETIPMIRVKSVRALDNYRLLIRFLTDEHRIFDFKPLLDKPCFTILKNKKVFDSVYVDYGCTVWNDGDIDIAPEYLFENSVPFNTASDTLYNN